MGGDAAHTLTDHLNGSPTTKHGTHGAAAQRFTRRTAYCTFTASVRLRLLLRQCSPSHRFGATHPPSATRRSKTIRMPPLGMPPLAPLRSQNTRSATRARACALHDGETQMTRRVHRLAKLPGAKTRARPRKLPHATRVLRAHLLLAQAIDVVQGRRRPGTGREKEAARDDGHAPRHAVRPAQNRAPGRRGRGREAIGPASEGGKAHNATREVRSLSLFWRTMGTPLRIPNGSSTSSEAAKGAGGARKTQERKLVTRVWRTQRRTQHAGAGAGLPRTGL